MKNVLLLSLCFVCQLVQAQWSTSGANIYTTNTVNVGIGTSNPAGKLHLSGPPPYVHSIVECTGDGQATLQLRSNGKIWMWCKRTASESDAISLYYSDGATWSTPPSMNILPNGNTGLSTFASTTYKLAVNGPAIFTKAIVKNYGDWPDYVFKKNYFLSPLPELEKYVRINNRLPEMPSADSVEKNGIDLGGNQTLLLKKVEELTLYLIEQDRQLKAQDQKMQEQDRALKSQQERIDRLERLIGQECKD